MRYTTRGVKEHAIYNAYTYKKALCNRRRRTHTQRAKRLIIPLHCISRSPTECLNDTLRHPIQQMWYGD